VEEWQRYQTLMRGPRGLWSPSMDPLWVLGMHARTDTERRRYAEMAVKQERARVEGEIAFSREYSETWTRLYGDEGLIDTEYFDKLQAQNKKKDALRKTGGTGKNAAAKTSASPASYGERVLLFVNLRDCPACESTAKSALARQKPASAPLDIYFADTDPSTDSDAIQAWARRHGVTLDAVRTRRVTLNHVGLLLAQFNKSSERLPLIMRRSGQSAIESTLEDAL
jgi:integrating conjugative element protein (TIGR03759 family)